LLRPCARGRLGARVLAGGGLSIALRRSLGGPAVALSLCFRGPPVALDGFSVAPPLGLGRLVAPLLLLGPGPQVAAPFAGLDAAAQLPEVTRRRGLDGCPR